MKPKKGSRYLFAALICASFLTLYDMERITDKFS